MKRLLTFLLLLAMVALVVTTVLGKPAPVVQRLDNPTILSTQPDGRQACQVGNLEPPVWAVSGWITGNEGYKYLVIPAEECPECAQFPGFTLRMVHMLVQFSELQVPSTFVVVADLEDAVFDPDTGCWWPGIEDCISEPVEFQITDPGLYDIAVPIDCPCAFFYDNMGLPIVYMISLHFLSEVQADLIIDETPTPCLAYNDWGQGWVDLYDYLGQYGDPIIWADLDCCEDPVADEATTWGQVKSLYR